MSKVEEVLNRLKQKYNAYEEEVNYEGVDDGGIIDVSIACELADSVPYLIEQIEKYRKALERIDNLPGNSNNPQEGVIIAREAKDIAHSALN